MNAERAEQVGGDDEITNPMARAWLMRYRDRATFREIKEALNISLGTAHAWVQKAQQAIDFASGDEAAERARDLAAADEWLARLYGASMTGEVDVPTASREARGWITWRATVLGYSAPRKSAITIEPPHKDATPDPVFMEEMRKARAQALRMEAMEAEDGLDDYAGGIR